MSFKLNIYVFIVIFLLKKVFKFYICGNINRKIIEFFSRIRNEFGIYK